MVTFLFALLVAGVSIALVLLCVLIVAVFWFAWRKSQVSHFLIYLLLYIYIYIIYIIEHEISAFHLSLRFLMFICTVVAFPLGGGFCHHWMAFLKLGCLQSKFNLPLLTSLPGQDLLTFCRSGFWFAGLFFIEGPASAKIIEVFK